MKQLLVTVNRKRPSFLPVFLFVLAFLLVGQSGEAQRLSYSSGQNISPGYEGWEEDPDGSRWFVFGYMNRNWEDEPNIFCLVETDSCSGCLSRMILVPTMKWCGRSVLMA